jgi:hypothetical protein
MAPGHMPQADLKRRYKIFVRYEMSLGVNSAAGRATIALGREIGSYYKAL